MRWMHQSVRCK